MADTMNRHVLACLQRRRQLLDAAPDEWMGLARRAFTQTEPVLKAWVQFDPTGARGIPVGVKDVIDVQGFPTRAGSISRQQASASLKDSSVVSRLRALGIEPVGKTVTTEFAYLDAGATTNPFSVLHTPGGSSSGSAAAVGAGVVPLALGTQTAGSVCRPAAYCGTYAFKPSTGATPLQGVEPFAPTFDTIGVFGLDFGLVAKAAAAISSPAGKPASTPSPSMERKALAIGYLEDEYYLDISDECRDAMQAALDALRAAGHDMVPLHLGWQFELLRAEHRAVMHREAWEHHGDLLHSPQGLGRHWLAALENGKSLAPERVASARQSLASAREAALRMLAQVDVMLLPPARSTAPEGVGATGDAGLIVPWTFIGSPLAVIPSGLTSSGLPVAVMVAGKPGLDADAILASGRIANVLVDAGQSIDRSI